jgi:hypothetical protein
MGTWSVLSVTSSNEILNNSVSYGTTWKVTYRLKYTKSIFGKFVEPPKMDWDEIIYKYDYIKKTYYEFRDNMYTRKPDSYTMAVWAQRYFRAYLHAHNTPFNDSGRQKGYSKLFDKNGSPVSGRALGTHSTVAGQNKAVQNYLSSNGGILEIQVHDVPALLKKESSSTKEKNLERLLIFNCGVIGMGSRATGWQHLKMDSTQPEDMWYNNFQTLEKPPVISTDGLAKIDPEYIPSGNALPPGGIW